MAQSIESSFTGRQGVWDGGIVFSSRDGFVWASWPETGSAVRLGSHEMIADLMRDFLAHDELGKRLAMCRRDKGPVA